MDELLLAHGSNQTVEPELLVFGAAACVLAFFIRRNQEGGPAAALITLVVGVALILGAFALPRA